MEFESSKSFIILSNTKKSPAPVTRGQKINRFTIREISRLNTEIFVACLVYMKIVFLAIAWGLSK